MIDRNPGRRSAAKLLSKDGARRIAANIAKLRSCCGSLDDWAGLAAQDRCNRLRHTRQGKTTKGSALLRFRNKQSKSASHFSSVVKPAPFLRAFTSATSGASSRPRP